MKAAPNKTVLLGRLMRFDAAADGYGGEVEIEIARNESPDPAKDFLKPQTGARLRAFLPQPDPALLGLLAGRMVRAELVFLGGPGGGRAVVQELRAQ
jgi:hypothetical protein